MLEDQNNSQRGGVGEFSHNFNNKSWLKQVESLNNSRDMTGLKRGGGSAML